MKSICFRFVIPIILLVSISSCSIFQISEEYTTDQIKELYTKQYESKYISYSLFPLAKIDSINIDSLQNKVDIYFNKNFSSIPFRSENVDSIYNETTNFFASYYNAPIINIYSLGVNIKDLVPNFFRSEEEIDASRLPPPKRRPKSITFNKSKNLIPQKGLFDKNIALWHSHGWYYNHKLDRWLWQRARLFQTVEDIGPISFTLPYIVPMLENAGANVFLPRERDIQLNEIIIDNRDDDCHFSGNWNADTCKGFLMTNESLPANVNPFLLGDFDFAISNSNSVSTAEYIPRFKEDGKYSVYISYQSFKNSSENVNYTVFHSGGVTDFTINQTIGGSTWIYLGTFDFKQGQNPANGKVVISTNNSEDGSFVTTDAIRFGGGFGIVERNGKTSGKPKYIEGARYYMQFLGMPDTLVYNINGNENDYKDDYQGRGEWVNYLKGSPSGPNKNREVDGLGIPIDASIAFHTDAGISSSDTTIGTLLIYTLEDMDSSKYFPEGYSRFANRDFADIMQTQIVDDIRAKYDPVWNRRNLRDAQYSESTRPNIPSVLLELASHQNFLDVRFMTDPRFKFDVSRSIYKSVLKFLSIQHNFEYVVQPLPVTHFSITRKGENSILLSWKGNDDPHEETASPKSYRIYTSIDDSGFDNGISSKNNYCQIDGLEFGKIYNFKVTAVNEGGESFPSETLSCGFWENDNPLVMIVNCFDRVAPPAHIQTDQFAGFVNTIDQGVPYYRDIGFTGIQHNYFPESEWKTDDIPGHGASYADYETKVIAGNTFNYPFIHGKAFLSNHYSFISASDEAVESERVKLSDYKIVDLIFGEEKTTHWTKPYSDSLLGLQYKVFSNKLIKQIDDLLNNRGNIFLSGSYIGTDVFINNSSDDSLKSFVENKLRYKLSADHAVVKGDVINYSPNFLSPDFNFKFITELNDKFYNAEAPDAITPTNGSELLLRYVENFFSAGIGYKDDYGVVAFGFPFETIESEFARFLIIKSILNYFYRD